MFYLLLLSIAVWLTYWHTIGSGFVSDDIEGLQGYDGKLKKFDYGHLNKWLLYKLLDKSPTRNHLFSIILHNANVILLFLFLSSHFPTNVSFYTSVIFAIHPICTQSVAWISSRGYLISLFFCLLGFNIISIARTIPIFTQNIQSLPFALLIILYFGIYYISITAQFATLSTFILHMFMGNYFLAALGAIVSFYAGLGIVREVINIRKSVFKEQNLERSTKFNISKVIVAIKTLGYYTRICLFPKRLGLYHTFEYHYNDKTEKEDRRFWFGFFILVGLLLGLYYGNTVIRFAIIWYLAYVFVFLNWITIHQFVSERYVYIPFIGIAIIVSCGLVKLDTLLFGGYPVLLALIAGLYLMRTWAHLPAYNEEVSFYQSNIWNFPDSEVAFGNLGVVYMKLNLYGSAFDMWNIAVKINPDYDVAYYNISSVLKQKGDFVGSRDNLKKAIASKHCHFKELWNTELAQLEHEINYVQELNTLNGKLVSLEKEPDKMQQVKDMRKQLDEVNNLHKKFEEHRSKQITLITAEERQLRERLIQLGKDKDDVSKPKNITELINARDNNFKYIKEAAEKLSKIEVVNAKT